jgi:hypothetical protein
MAVESFRTGCYLLNSRYPCNLVINCTTLYWNISEFQSLYYPTNALNVKNVELLKQIKIMEAAATCFGLQRSHHQGATASA